MSSIEQIAGKHLGKAGDGTTVAPYVTPTAIDSSLLVAVPRILNRTQYGIDSSNLPFAGVDVWNAYEFSALTNNGYPVVAQLKIVYPAESENIVESKSLKLYLNSFNMARLARAPQEVLSRARATIEEHLTEVLGISSGHVYANFFDRNSVSNPAAPFMSRFISLDDYLDVSTLTFDSIGEDPSLLIGQDWVVPGSREICVRSSVLRSNCRVTNQPDWGDVFIYMRSNMSLKYEGLLKYLVSMRTENHFHEEICEAIYMRLNTIFNPDALLVGCLYTRRGGIDINPVRVSSRSLMHSFCPDLVDADVYVEKLWRQ